MARLCKIRKKEPQHKLNPPSLQIMENILANTAAVDLVPENKKFATEIAFSGTAKYRAFPYNHEVLPKENWGKR